MTEDLSRPDEEAAEAARRRVLQAVDDAIAATRTIADPDRAYDAAKLLVQSLRAATTSAGQVHAQTVAQIQEALQLSYAALGRRLGISKGRAEQLVKAVEAARPDTS